ncbi:MAG: hypothetical protein TE42_06690 [Candidatus Synechococcus spongiarum SP3]|uniref:Uncharacterized protein n=1 Tax=Candidatus Synechococcus spongiarum SP3 TaxID=1604020 RepID=A0A0G2HKI1_9SYNE|nr:MAG: hypothetical protein TE42_06690 [Candidatus Synechococcus spongiarum SP3]
MWLARSFRNQKATRLEEFICSLQDAWKVIKKVEEVVGKNYIVGPAYRLHHCSINKEINVVDTLFCGLYLADLYHLN